jgi:hypothetical protein
MQLEGQKVLRKGSTRRRYRTVDAGVSTRLSDDGSEILFETSVPVSKGFSDVCVVLPVERLADLVRMAVARPEAA